MESLLETASSSLWRCLVVSGMQRYDQIHKALTYRRTKSILQLFVLKPALWSVQAMWHSLFEQSCVGRYAPLSLERNHYKLRRLGSSLDTQYPRCGGPWLYR
eukprot:1136340-Pelagomonas_calceolata.AAC.2